MPRDWRFTSRAGPERTIAYQVVQRHLETWLERAKCSDPDGDAIPEHVERDFRSPLANLVFKFPSLDRIPSAAHHPAEMSD